MTRVARPESLPPAADRFVVVEASAGTGKTFFLEHRVVDLIVAGAELGQILLVTFTDKAVAELRLRIRDLLDRMARAEGDSDAASAWDIDDDVRARLRAAVVAFDHAPIFTIHGFCHRVLLEDAFAAQRLFEQHQVADEVAFGAAFSVLVRERFAHLAPDRELLEVYLSHGGTVDTLRKLLLDCTRADAVPRRHFDAEAAIALRDSLFATFGTADARARLIAALALKGNDKRYVPPWIDEIGEAITAWDGHPAHVLAVCAAKEPREHVVKLLERVIKVPALATVADTLRDLAAAMPLDEAIAAQLLPPVLERIGADKAERGQFDYDDMLALVRIALHGPRGAELAARLRARMPWVMIDEFQDTDSVQWDIFRTVWMHDDARGLTIVGDPKQAIYGFRGADVATYQAARDELLRIGATAVTLDVNRRSTEPLVEAINTILLDQHPFAPLLDKAIRYDPPVRAGGGVVCDGVRPPVTVFALQGPGRGENREALAGAIGEEIDRLREAPPSWRRGDVSPKFTLGQVLVLTRSNSDSIAIGGALRARGIACALIENAALFETREAAELVAVLDAIAMPRDRSARMRALRSRFFDVPWPELMRVVDAPDHHPLIARLFDWASLAARRAYETLFRRLFEDSRYAERALVLGGGERALVNTWHLIELLTEQVARSRCDLHELVGQLRRWIADRDDLPDDRDVQRAETDADAVRILTIHKAKGLEAPYVFLFGAASPPPATKVHALRDPAGRMLVVDPRDEAVRQHLRDEATGENQRLAYVALTRAQVRLYLPLYGDKVVDDASTYQPIQRCLTPLVARHHALFETIAVVVGADPTPPPPPNALADFDAPPPPVTTELVPLERARAGLAMLSYTRLSGLVAAAALEPGELPLAIDPAEFDVDFGSGEVGAAELPPGADTGLLLHDLFEHADLALIRRAPNVDAWRAEPSVARMLTDHARERGIAEHYLPQAARVVYATLTTPLALSDGHELPPLATATALAREVEFTYPIPGLPVRGLVRGYIDALVAWNDELWVLDYKSDQLIPATPAAAIAHVAEHYAVQARLYAIAGDLLRGTRRLAGLLFAFVRYGVVVPVRVTENSLGDWSQWLHELPDAPSGEARP